MSAEDLPQGSGRWQRMVPHMIPPAHVCDWPAVDLDQVGHGSIWRCGCGKDWQLNRRGASYSWGRAN